MRLIALLKVPDLLATNTALCTLLATDLLVMLAELSAVVVLPWWINSSGGPDAIAAFSVVLAVSAFIAVPAVSPFGDRVCKVKQIALGLACLSVIACVQVVLAEGRAFSIPSLLALAVVQVVATSFVDPARDAILIDVVAKDELPMAIRFRKNTQAFAGILGPLMAGVALSCLGVAGALYIYVALLIAAMVLALRLPRNSRVMARSSGMATWWSDLRAGLSAKWFVPMERGWTMVSFMVWIFQGPAVGMLIPIKVHSLGLAGNWLGLCLGALSSGVLLGSAFGSQMLVNRFGRHGVRVGLGFLEGIAFSVVGVAEAPHVMLAGLGVAGFCNASMGLVGATHRALAIPRAYRVRMSAAASMTTQLAGSIGPGLVGMALGTWSIGLVYTTWGLLMAASVLGFLLVPRLKEFLSLDHEQIADWYERQYPAVFK